MEKESLEHFMKEGEKGRETDRAQKDQKYGTQVEKRQTEPDTGTCKQGCE
jgi:hypothetical protein